MRFGHHKFRYSVAITVQIILEWLAVRSDSRLNERAHTTEKTD
jgi:hypothetical protein